MSQPAIQRFLTRTAIFAATGIMLYACGGRVPVVQDRDSGPREPVDVSDVQDATPRTEPRSRYGNPQSYVVLGKRYYVMDSAEGYVERGIASWYGTKFHGRRTSSGEVYDMYAMTAAHKTLPLPTYVQVTNLRNGRSVVVKVNDRGPFHANRIIDLSYAAASKLGITGEGTGLVEIKAIEPSAPAQTTRVAYHPSDNPLPAALPAPAQSASPGLYLQVGAFSDQINAERLSDKLQEIVLSAVQIQRSQDHASPVYRVRIGPIASVEDADHIAELLAAQGIADAHIVID